MRRDSSNLDSITYGFLDPHESTPNGISIDSAVYAQDSRVTNTQTQTDTQTTLRATTLRAIATGRMSQYCVQTTPPNSK